ncbi:hypothetical protein [Poriferisphaera sp. WC338]|uniref:hypothetical protein n=1 Tax=Poriferisphaera sp. WC338 TaxID=3425129 RepID=UPI003D81AF01
MNMHENDSTRRDQLDQATSGRLAALRAHSAEESQLLDIEKRIADALPITGPSFTQKFSWPHRFAAAASVVLAIGLLALIFILSANNTAHASITNLATLHIDLLQTEAVADIAHLNQTLQRQIEKNLADRTSPLLVESCCLQNKNARLLAAVSYQAAGLSREHVSVVVAEGEDFAVPMGETILQGDRALYIHDMPHLSVGLNMVMAQSGDRWLCVMGQGDRDRLIEIASQIVF